MNRRPARALLAKVIESASADGYARCAVDFEAHNIHGSRFWLRHFTPVAYSVLRRLDERISCGRNKSKAPIPYRKRAFAFSRGEGDRGACPPKPQAKEGGGTGMPFTSCVML